MATINWRPLAEQPVTPAGPRVEGADMLYHLVQLDAQGSQSSIAGHRSGRYRWCYSLTWSFFGANQTLFTYLQLPCITLHHFDSVVEYKDWRNRNCDAEIRPLELLQSIQRIKQHLCK